MSSNLRYLRYGVMLFGVVSTLGIATMGCKPQQNADPSPTPDPTQTVTPVGTVSETGGFYVQALFKDPNSQDENAEILIDHFLHEQSSFTTECKVAKDETNLAKKDIYCILDIAELDLYFNGLKFNYNAPSGMCKYVEIRGYNYFANEPSPPGHTASVGATYTDGAFTSGTSNNGVSMTKEGLTCNYDYTLAGGPNCCSAIVTSTTTYTYTDGVTPTTVETNVAPYGGNRANCLDGPAMDAPFEKTSSGWPMSLIAMTAKTGVNKPWIIKSPISKVRWSNIRVANYFKPSDFGAGSDTFPQTQKPTPVVFPYYEFGCLDTADDYTARIRVMIRPWDRVDNFTAHSNPYTHPTTEPQYGDDYNDRSGWSRFLNTYPGD